MKREEGAAIRGNRRGVGLLLLCLAVMVLAPDAVAAQQEASIIGQVTDSSGAILPGVTVTAASPALQVREMQAVTDEGGEYRLTPLPIGTYEVTYELPGFQTLVRQGIRLTVGFTARLDVTLQLGAVAETVTVSGASPVVDIVSTAPTTQLTRETLELIPTTRNGMIGLMAQTPGVRPNLDVGGSALNGTVAYQAYGQQSETWNMVEGVAVFSLKTETQGGQWTEYNAFEEASIRATGHGAEVATRGIAINSVVKAGGNDFHGNAFWGQTPKTWQSSNVTPALAAQGISAGEPLEERWDVSGELGGRILRDKLWFFYTARRRNEERVALNVFKPDGSLGISKQSQPSSTGKLTYSLDPKNRIIGFAMWAEVQRQDAPNQYTDWDARSYNFRPAVSTKAEWQSVISNSLLTSLQYGYWGYKTDAFGFSDQPATTDQLTSRVTGLSTGHGRGSLENRHHTKGTVNWFGSDILAGNHDVRLGVDYMRTRVDRPWASRGAAGNSQLVLRNGEAFQLRLFNYPIEPFTFTHYLGLYVQDSWTIARRLTLNLGVRYANDKGFMPEQCRGAADPPAENVFPAVCVPEVRYKTWNPIVPRLRAAYDLTGDAKTVLSGGWGRYAHLRKGDELQLSNQLVGTQVTYAWHDLNRNGRYEPGEVDLDLNGRDFEALTLQGTSSALANGVPNPNEKEPMTDEFTLTVERELIPDLGVRLTGIYSRMFNVYRLQNNKRPYDVFTTAITNPDPGPDGRAGTADDPGTSITYYEYPATYAGLRFQEPMLVNDPNATRTYKTIEVAGHRRMANGWQFMASYSATRTQDPLVTNAGGGSQIPISTLDPNAEIFAEQNTWEWLARASGAYTFPADILVSANFEHRSGNVFARTVSVRGGRQIRSLTVRVEPIGARRMPNINLLDARVQKSFRMAGAQSVRVRLDFYNVTNSSTVLGVTSLSGPNFMRVTSIMPPRTLELSASYAF